MSESDATRYRDELRARRECLEGAQQTLKMIAATLRGAQSLDLARSALLGPTHERIVLVAEAIRNTDAALKDDR